MFRARHWAGGDETDEILGVLLVERTLTDCPVHVVIIDGGWSKGRLRSGCPVQCVCGNARVRCFDDVRWVTNNLSVRDGRAC